jgi:hypothetical protein
MRLTRPQKRVAEEERAEVVSSTGNSKGAMGNLLRRVKKLEAKLANQRYLYQNWGRFLTADPTSSGQPVIPLDQMEEYPPSMCATSTWRKEE